MRTLWVLLLTALVIWSTGCTDASRQVQIHAADSTAEAANAALPILVAKYREEGARAIQAAETREAAEAGTAEVKTRWEPVWTAWEALRVAQDAWATALETEGGDLLAALAALKTAYCGLRAAWPEDIPAVPLAPFKCE